LEEYNELLADNYGTRVLFVVESRRKEKFGGLSETVRGVAGAEAIRSRGKSSMTRPVTCRKVKELLEYENAWADSS